MISQLDSDGNFKRMDIVIKYMAIHDLLNEDGNGLNYYTRLYKGVCGTSDLKITIRTLSLKEMYNSMKNGIVDTETHPVLLTRNNNIWDGSHRIACTCYCNKQYIYVKYNKKEFRGRGGAIGLGVDKLNNIFAYDEINTIINTQESILNKIGMGKLEVSYGFKRST